MLHLSTIILVSFTYLGVLFGVAYYGDKRARSGRSIIANPYIYALSLAVYCSTWTFYGSVGRAASSGVGFLPIYVGPTLAAGLWWYVMRKIIRISKTYRITSIADFIATRYGKSQMLGGLVTVIAVIGVVPYISLQLKAISGSLSILVRYPQTALPTGAVGRSLVLDSALYIAVVLAAFTILFGTRRLDTTERHEGLVAAIAFESIVKLVSLLAVGAFVTFGVYRGFGEIFKRAQEEPRLVALMTPPAGGASYGTWASLVFLSILSIMFLPRQFQVSVVENVDENHLGKAIWLFPLYLLLINIFVLPIAFGGLMLFAPGAVDADTFVLTLPMARHKEALALFAFIGGLSAGTGMVIVETIALSSMVCNDLVMPALLRAKWLRLSERRDLSGLLLSIRRSAIVGVLLLGYIYFYVSGEAYALVSIGLFSFAAVAQFAPAILGGIYWRGGTRAGAMAGLSAGFAAWAYTLLLPSFAKSGWLPAGYLTEGPLGVALLRPQQLFGLTGLDEISHCLFWSMLANIGAYVGVSLLSRPSVTDAKQAALFVGVFGHTQGLERPSISCGSASAQDLLALVGRFLGPDRAHEAFVAYARERDLEPDALRADADLVHFAEAQLAGTIGGASARVMVSSVVQEEPPGFDEVMDILDEASQLRAYSARLEEKSRELEMAKSFLEAEVAERRHAEAIVERHQRALSTLSQCNEALVRASDEQSLLDSVCRIVVGVGGYRMAWVGFAERDDRKTVRPVAHAGHEEGYLATVDIVWADTEQGRGPVSRAIREGRPVCAKDFLLDPKAPWSPEAAKRGYASSAALPLVAESATLGALSIYATEVDAFDEDEIRLLTELADDLAYGIAALRGRAHRAMMTAQLAQADRLAATGTLAAGVAHEINNPLAYVIAAHDFLAHELKSIAHELPAGRVVEASQALSEAQEGAGRVKQIVRDLKTFSRPDEEQIGLIDLRRVMESSINIAFNEIKHRARLVKDYQATPFVKANEARLGQVFINLLINAAQAIPEGHANENEIRVVTKWSDHGRAIVEVADTGSGIPRDLLKRIFDPFFTTKPVGIGTGLGLSICRSIVGTLGGEITVESQVGKGTLFRVELPAPAPVAEAMAGHAPRVEQVRRGRVLVVDDELLVGSAVRRALASENEVLVLTNAREARGRIASGERFDVILCDLMMPEVTGMDLHAELSALAPDQAQQMVFLSGGAFTPMAAQFLDQVSNERIEKPFDPAGLRALVRSRVRSSSPPLRPASHAL